MDGHLYDDKGTGNPFTSSIPVGVGTIPAGTRLVVAVLNFGVSVLPTSLTDSQGNTYNADGQVSYGSGSQSNTTVYSSVLAHALVGGTDTISVNGIATASIGIQVYQFDSGTGALDAVGHTHGSTNPLTFNTSTDPVQATEVVFFAGMDGTSANDGAATYDSGYTGHDSQVATHLCAHCEFRVFTALSTSSPASVAPTFHGSSGWRISGVIATYKTASTGSFTQSTAATQAEPTTEERAAGHRVVDSEGQAAKEGRQVTHKW